MGHGGIGWDGMAGVGWDGEGMQCARQGARPWGGDFACLLGKGRALACLTVQGCSSVGAGQGARLFDSARLL